MLFKSKSTVDAAASARSPKSKSNAHVSMATDAALKKAKEIIRNGGTQAEAAAAAKEVAREILKQEAQKAGMRNGSVNSGMSSLTAPPAAPVAHSGSGSMAHSASGSAKTLPAGNSVLARRRNRKKTLTPVQENYGSPGGALPPIRQSSMNGGFMSKFRKKKGKKDKKDNKKNKMQVQMRAKRDANIANNAFDAADAKEGRDDTETLVRFETSAAERVPGGDVKYNGNKSFKVTVGSSDADSILSNNPAIKVKKKKPKEKPRETPTPNEEPSNPLGQNDGSPPVSDSSSSFDSAQLASAADSSALGFGSAYSSYESDPYGYSESHSRAYSGSHSHLGQSRSRRSSYEYEELYPPENASSAFASKDRDGEGGAGGGAPREKDPNILDVLSLRSVMNAVDRALFPEEEDMTLDGSTGSDRKRPVAASGSDKAGGPRGASSPGAADKGVGGSNDSSGEVQESEDGGGWFFCCGGNTTNTNPGGGGGGCGSSICTNDNRSLLSGTAGSLSQIEDDGVYYSMSKKGYVKRKGVKDGSAEKDASASKTGCKNGRKDGDGKDNDNPNGANANGINSDAKSVSWSVTDQSTASGSGTATLESSIVPSKVAAGSGGAADGNVNVGSGSNSRGTFEAPDTNDASKNAPGGASTGGGTTGTGGSAGTGGSRDSVSARVRNILQNSSLLGRATRAAVETNRCYYPRGGGEAGVEVHGGSGNGGDGDGAAPANATAAKDTGPKVADHNPNWRDMVADTVETIGPRRDVNNNLVESYTGNIPHGQGQFGNYSGSNPQGMGNQVMNIQGMNNQGMNNQVMNIQGMNNQGMNNAQGMNPMNPPGANPPGIPQGMINPHVVNSAQVMNNQGVGSQGVKLQGMGPQDMSRRPQEMNAHQGMSNLTMSTQVSPRSLASPQGTEQYPGHQGSLQQQQLQQQPRHQTAYQRNVQWQVGKGSVSGSNNSSVNSSSSANSSLNPLPTARRPFSSMLVTINSNLSVESVDERQDRYAGMEAEPAGMVTMRAAGGYGASAGSAAMGGGYGANNGMSGIAGGNANNAYGVIDSRGPPPSQPQQTGSPALRILMSEDSDSPKGDRYIDGQGQNLSPMSMGLNSYGNSVQQQHQQQDQRPLQQQQYRQQHHKNDAMQMVNHQQFGSSNRHGTQHIRDYNNNTAMHHHPSMNNGPPLSLVINSNVDNQHVQQQQQQQSSYNVNNSTGAVGRSTNTNGVYPHQLADPSSVGVGYYAPNSTTANNISGMATTAPQGYSNNNPAQRTFAS